MIMASGTEVKRIKFTWEDTYDNPAAWIESSDSEEQNMPYFKKEGKYDKNSRSLKFVGYCHQEKDVKAQVSRNGDTSQCSPVKIIHEENESKSGILKFIVTVDITKAKSRSGEWYLHVFNSYGSRGGKAATSNVTVEELWYEPCTLL